MSKRVLSTLCCLAIFLLTAPAVLAAPPAPASKLSPARIKAAEQYWKVGQFDAMLQKSLSKGSERLKPEQKKQLEELLKKVATDKKLRQEAIKTTASNFSTAELKAMTKFYSTAEGRSIMDKMPAYMAELSRVIQTRVIEIIQAQQPPKVFMRKPDGKKPAPQKQ